MHVYAMMTWFVLVLVASVLAIVIWQRRRRGGAVFAAVVFFGALGSYLLFQSDVDDPTMRLLGLGSLVMAGVGLLGLIPERLPRNKCHECDYDFRGETAESCTRCPECGTPRASMRGHCLECKKDVRQAIAGGSIKCPYCGTAIPDPRR